MGALLASRGTANSKFAQHDIGVVQVPNGGDSALRILGFVFMLGIFYDLNRSLTFQLISYIFVLKGEERDTFIFSLNFTIQALAACYCNQTA